jgi:hypothetical protein
MSHPWDNRSPQPIAFTEQSFTDACEKLFDSFSVNPWTGLEPSLFLCKMSLQEQADMLKNGRITVELLKSQGTPPHVIDEIKRLAGV